MAQINPYLTFNGNCEEAFLFYKEAFGREFQFIGRFKDTPSQNPISEELGNKIMHVSLPVSQETVLMGSDADEAFGNIASTGNNISLSINTQSENEADALFAKLSEGGRITMPMEKTFWGAYFGMFTDKFGINWMINYDYEQK